jgi:hypothetical protein
MVVILVYNGRGHSHYYCVHTLPVPNKQDFRVFSFMFRRRICSATTSASEVLCSCGIGRNENEISKSEDNDVDTGQGSSVPTGAKKRKTFRRPQWTTLATATQDPRNAPPLGFRSTWGTDTGSVPPMSYPNWPWM